MSRLLKLALAVSAAGLPLLASQALPAQAATATPTPVVKRALLVGELGIRGGAYPGRFHPTPGIVEVDFAGRPLVIVEHVGPSGQFKFSLAPGKYTVVGCGGSSIRHLECSKPKSVKLSPGEVDFVEVVWADVP